MEQTPIQSNGDWVNEQTAELLRVLPTYPDDETAARDILERAAEALEAEVGALVRDDEVIATVGFALGKAPVDLLRRAVTEGSATQEIPGLGPCRSVVVSVGEDSSMALMLARSGDDEFTHFERGFIRSVTRVLALAFQINGMVEHERTLRASLEERQRLLEKLSRIQSSISHRAPLQEVLDAVTKGASELLDVEVAGLRLIDPDDSQSAILVSCSGIAPENLEKIRRSPLSEGAGGRAILEGRLYVLDAYESAPDAIPFFAADHLQVAMAAPVLEDGEVVGSLVVATYDSNRRYGDSEREMLIALADHASIALTDARTVESMREAHRTKDLFFAMVSHELKTPLTVIMGTLSTLRRHLARLPEEIREEMLRSSWERGKDLERLIDMLLKGARAELAGVQREALLQDVVAGAVSGFANSRELVVGPVPDATIFVDDLAIHQIIGILLENAISHSPPDSSVTVNTTICDSAVRIEVANAGSLPAGAELAKLFLPFERGSGNQRSGVGLGLHIASQLTESVGGQIEASSDEGTVCFAVVFPFDPTPANHPSNVKVPQGSSV